MSDEKPRVVLDYSRPREEPLPTWFWLAFGVVVLCGFGCGPFGWIMFLLISPIWLGLAFGRLGVVLSFTVNLSFMLVLVAIGWIYNQLQQPARRAPSFLGVYDLLYGALFALLFSQIAWAGAILRPRSKP